MQLPRTAQAHSEHVKDLLQIIGNHPTILEGADVCHIEMVFSARNDAVSASVGSGLAGWFDRIHGNGFTPHFHELYNTAPAAFKEHMMAIYLLHFGSSE